MKRSWLYVSIKTLMNGFDISLTESPFDIGMVGIIMILVHCLDNCRDIHNAGAGMPRVPYQPVVPTRTADHERRRIFVIKTARKNKIVDPLRRTLVIRFTGQAPYRCFPVRGVKVHGSGAIE